GRRTGMDQQERGAAGPVPARLPPAAAAGAQVVPHGRRLRPELRAAGCGMSAVLSPSCGDHAAIRAAQAGNATYSRAREFGYSRPESRRLAALAKRLAADWESPHQVAARVVEPPHTPRGPGPGGGSPGTGVAA